MLVLTRKIDQSLAITTREAIPAGTRLTVTFVNLDVRRREIRLGVEATHEFEINRGEIQDRIDLNRRRGGAA